MAHPTQPPRQSFLSSDRTLARIARPLRTFLHTEAAGGIVLLVATVAALGLANSPLAESFEKIWQTELRLSMGAFELTEDLRHFVNDALMAIFFFVVGLEIKREIVLGELSDRRKAALPAIAALGGMVVPAAVYLLFNAGGPGSRGLGDTDGHRHRFRRRRACLAGQPGAFRAEGLPAQPCDRGRHRSDPGHRHLLLARLPARVADRRPGASTGDCRASPAEGDLDSAVRPGRSRSMVRHLRVGHTCDHRRGRASAS